MYLLPYVILKIILITSTVAEPVLEILLPAENGQTLTNVDQSNSANDDEKTLAQQIYEGKYGLIHKELFNDIPSRPGILSYNINPEVPKDNINNLGGLDPDEIWLAENHLLVLRGGNFSNKKVKWSYIDNFIAPLRQVKIPENPKIPPPFPIQLEDNGPIDFVSINSSTWNPIFPPPFPPIQGLPPPNTTFDEDDQSLFYPPKYDFVYTQENSTRVPPGPLVPGIVLPPPPNFFGPLERAEKVKKISLNTNKTIPRFNQKPYLKIPKGNHNAKDNVWVPIPSIKPNYIEGLKIKNNILITTTENNNNYNSNYNEQSNFQNHQFFLENPVDHTTSRPESYYYYEENNKYDVEKPAQHNKYVDSNAKNQQFDFQNNYEKSTTVKPYHEYSYIAPEYDIKSQIQNPIHKNNPIIEYQKERPVYQEWSEKPKHSYQNNQMEKQKYQSLPQQNNQYSDIDYGYQTEKPNFATDNPYHAFFTQDDASLVDENTKKYFALFGQKVRTEKPTQVTTQSKHHNKNGNKMTSIDNELVNSKKTLPTNNLESEITTVKPYKNYSQISLHNDINVNFKQSRPQINPNAEVISQNPNDFKEMYSYPLDNSEINYNQQLPIKNINLDQVLKKPHIIQASFQSNIPKGYNQPFESKNQNLEPITQQPHLNVPQSSLLHDTQVNYKEPLPSINLNAEIITQRPSYVIPSLFDNTNINYKRPLEYENLNVERVTQRPQIHVTQSPLYDNINYNGDSVFVTKNPNSEHVTQKTYIQVSQTPFYDTSVNNNKTPYSFINPSTERVTKRPYINIPATSIQDGIRVNYKPQKYSNTEIVTQRPYLEVTYAPHIEDSKINYHQTILQQNPNIEGLVKRPHIKFPQKSLIDDTRFNFKRPLPLRNHDTEYFTQRPQSILYPHTPVSLIDDIQINYKQPMPTKNIDTEYIVSTQRPLNRVVSYNLPGNSGSHFFFLTTHTGHPIQYNLGNHNYQFYKRNVK